MAKYRSHGNYDDQFTEDGDVGFIGLDQLHDPSQLEQGRYQYGENIRIVGGKIRTRDGLVAHNYYDKTNQELLHQQKAVQKMCSFSSPTSSTVFSELVGITGSSYVGKVSLPPLANGVPRSDFSFPRSFHMDWEVYPNYFEYASQVIQANNQLVVFPAWKTGERPITIDPMNPQATVFNTFALSSSQEIIHCPRAPFGIYYQNRLIVPRYDVSPTTTIISDILSINSFPLTNEFTANRGYGDLTLGYAPMVEDQLLVLNKNSIHVISGIANGGERISEITRQHGVAGHSSFANNGSYVYFVSSEGNLEVLVPQLDPAKGLGIAVSKLNLDSQPLSDMVSGFMERVNMDAIDTCVVHYSKNLVYFALPIDGARMANCILIYSSLHSAFIGVDTFNHIPDNANTVGQSDVHRLLIHDLKTHKNQVWMSTNLGMFKYDEGAGNDAGWEISTSFKSRDYLAQSTSVKKFTKGAINYSADPAEDQDSHTQIEVGSKVKILSLPSDPAYQGGGTGWLQVGQEYEVVGYDETVVYEVLLSNPDAPAQRVGLKLSERSTSYDLTRQCLFEVRTNCTSPTFSNQLAKSVSIGGSISENLSGFNISRRGQTVNIEFSANSPIKVDNLQVEAFVANARTVGDYK